LLLELICTSKTKVFNMIFDSITVISFTLTIFFLFMLSILAYMKSKEDNPTISQRTILNDVVFTSNERIRVLMHRVSELEGQLSNMDSLNYYYNIMPYPLKQELIEVGRNVKAFEMSSNGSPFILNPLERPYGALQDDKYITMSTYLKMFDKCFKCRIFYSSFMLRELMPKQDQIICRYANLLDCNFFEELIELDQIEVISVPNIEPFEKDVFVY
jgi:hypothetical protein